MKKALLTLVIFLMTVFSISVLADEIPEFQITANSSEIYEDVAEDSWYKESIDGVVSLGIMNGTSQLKFEPNADTSRGALVTVLWRITGNPETEAELPFTDLTQNWYENAVKWAYASGVVNGTGEKTFSPDNSISREALATVLYRYLSYMKGDTSVPVAEFDFSDIDKVSSWAKDAVEWAVSNGIISGSNGALLPAKSATRAEIATIVMRFCKKYKTIFSIEDDPSEDEKHKDIPIQLASSYVKKYYASEISTLSVYLRHPEEWEFVQRDEGGADVVRDGKTVGRMIAGGAQDLDKWKIVDWKSKEEGDFKVSQFVEKYGRGITLKFRYRYLYEYIENDEDMALTLILDANQVSSVCAKRLYGEAMLEEAQTATNYGLLSNLEGKKILIAGNSFVGTSKIGYTLHDIVTASYKTLSVYHWSVGYARISTYIENVDFMNNVKNGDYDAIFMCGLYEDDKELDALDTLYSECERSDTQLIIFPAHNESKNMVRKAKNLFPELVLIDWKTEVEALITNGVDKWDMCVNDAHLHSTPLAGYVGAHMIYRAIFGENPKGYPTRYVTKQDVEEKLGNYINSPVVSIVKDEELIKIK